MSNPPPDDSANGGAGRIAPVDKPVDGETSGGDPAGTQVAVSGRVLLLEDDPTFREIIQQIFAEHDYVVKAVPTGVEGIKEVIAGDFAAVVCDMQMPGMSGEAFYRAVQYARPRLCERFVFMTGFRGDDSANNFVKSVNAYMLHKPFLVDDLLDVIGFIQIRNLPTDLLDFAPLETPAHAASDAAAPQPATEASLSMRADVTAPELRRFSQTAAALPGKEAPAIERSRPISHAVLGTFAGLALFALLAAVPAGRYLDLRERSVNSSVELMIREQQWAEASAELEAAGETGRKSEALERFARRIASERAAPTWAPAFRSIVTAAGSDIVLTRVQTRGGEDGNQRRDVLITGVCTGPDARMSAERFRKNLEEHRRQQFGGSLAEARFESLENEPPSPSGTSGTQRLAFTIVLTTDAKPLTEPAKGGGS